MTVVTHDMTGSSPCLERYQALRTSSHTKSMIASLRRLKPKIAEICRRDDKRFPWNAENVSADVGNTMDNDPGRVGPAAAAPRCC
ncbi:hypothetical protein JYU34_010914 [Plutella xylostella]|uniref:Uncharacterized protein n=1 Tax=Plutella xylostella TaxID=51655 RepID=A0ABQ7QGD7_PLUXY|nr:hypothetical protein JYU34_010914 [Plutella xylostella]